MEVVMKKSLRVCISGLESPKHFLDALKVRVNVRAAEGVAFVGGTDSVELDVVGDRDNVDDVLAAVETVIFFEKQHTKKPIAYSAQPFVVTEDYRGVLRFIAS
jgi:hypothetical protein